MNIKELVESWEGKSKEQIIESLMNELKEINKEEKINKKWVPEHSKEYWYVGYNGEIYMSIWGGSCHDKWHYLTGNVFKTEEEAEEHGKKLEIQSRFKNFVEEHTEELDWGNYNQDKYYLYYAYDTKRICFEHVWKCKDQGTIYASSEQILRDAIKEIGENNIIKYVLEV